MNRGHRQTLCKAESQLAIAVGTLITGCPPGGRGRLPAPRLPQNVACRFPALRSSEGASQHGDSLQLRVREIQLWSHYWKPLLDLLELLPQDLTLPTPTAEHNAPVTLYDPMDPLQGSDVPGNAVVRIVAAKHWIEDVRLVSDRQVPHPPHLVLHTHAAIVTFPYAVQPESCLSDCECSTA